MSINLKTPLSNVTELIKREYTDLNEEAHCFYELCKIKASQGDKEGALQLLAQAKGVCDQLLKKEQNDKSTEIQGEGSKALAADIHGMIAKLATQSNDLENGIKFYGKAASFLPNTPKANQYRLELGLDYPLNTHLVYALIHSGIYWNPTKSPCISR